MWKSRPSFACGPGASARTRDRGAGPAGDEVVFLADVLHHTVHAAHPEWDRLGDQDAELALATRRRLLAELAMRAVPVFAAHISASRPLLVETDEGGSSRFEPWGVVA